MTLLKKDLRIRVCGILIDQDKMLLIAHKKDNEVYWLLPGGGVDYGESLHEALCREMLEELNICVHVEDMALVCDSIDPSGGRHVVNICFFCRYESGNFLLGQDERLHDFMFFSENELREVEIFPPINNELASILKYGPGKGRYIGKLWK